jgi:hypothetical protein
MVCRTKAKGERYMAGLSRWSCRPRFYDRTNACVTFLERMRLLGQDSLMGTRGKDVNILQHVVGFLKNHLLTDDKHELLGLPENYLLSDHLAGEFLTSDLN